MHELRVRQNGVQILVLPAANCVTKSLYTAVWSHHLRHDLLHRNDVGRARVRGVTVREELTPGATLHLHGP